MRLGIIPAVLFVVALASGQTSTTLEKWKTEASKGNAQAQLWLGMAFEGAKGTVQDFSQALRWLSQSALQGNADAQNLLGQMYEDAEGVPRDYAQAAKWYGAACAHRPDYGGAGQGCNNLGLLFLDGLGVKQNYLEAYKYFKLSPAKSNLKLAKVHMSAREVAEAEQRAAMWMRDHPDQ